MGDKKKILSDIYKEAKKKRIVHTQDEFANALDFKSRTHLFGRLMKGGGRNYG